ncbi:GMC oxidoreductase [Cristinia sonorae]|uniref:GMC oxidoreductase n=1 Tax=Cristinia sonorae TaxID=1940300 RepID=A0A8K0UMM8_9AGAR|nr:GMC oxidoreductase [Cristinia sonorae]
MPIVSVDEFVGAKLDYIVVGGGTAGLVAAARLTEDPNVTVGVLEAGKYHENAPEVNVPGMMARALHNPEFDWDFRTVPQKYLDDRVMAQSRGKGLGGSSLLNLLAMARPGKVELDAIEELGNQGWNWDTTLKYMKKSEHLDPPKLSPEDAVRFAANPKPENHGTDGPIAKSFPPHITECHTAVLDAMEANGLPRNGDNGDGFPVGGLLVVTSVDSKTATRSYAASAYYAPNATRPNFLIHLENADGTLQRATGVSFSHEEKVYTVTAANEVILAAGPFQSPQLLELSGIGDKDILTKFGIETKIDLPGVGENLQDHALVPTVVEVDQKVQSIEILFEPAGLAKQQELYQQQQGILAGIPSSVFAFMPGNVIGTAADTKKWKELTHLTGSAPEVFANTKPSVKKGIEKQYEILSRWIDNPIQPLAQLLMFNGPFPIPGVNFDFTKRHLTLLCAYTHPLHRGTVHINSTDPFAHPSIQQNYFSNPADLDILVRTVQWMKKVYETEPLKSLVQKRIVPTGEESEEELREWAKKMLATVHHPVGTCAMLPKELGGVVDNRLKVYGTSNLRVIDTSVIPLQISSNIQTLAYAVAEKGADIIKGRI